MSGGEYVWLGGYMVQQASPRPVVTPTPVPCPQCAAPLQHVPGTLAQRGFRACTACEHCEAL